MTARWDSGAILTAAITFGRGGRLSKDGGRRGVGQIGAAVGEAMSSLDESVSGETTAMLPFRRVPDELKGSLWQRAMDNVIPSAYAATCWEPVFGACNGGVRVKDFAGCTVGPRDGHRHRDADVHAHAVPGRDDRRRRDANRGLLGDRASTAVR